MKAIVNTRYGPPEVMTLHEVDRPVPLAGQVLIKVAASSVNALDWHLLRADPFFIRLTGAGLLKPKNTILGADIAGTVEAVGKDVRLFQPGDEVFGDLAASAFGGFGEYACGDETSLAKKPAGMSFEAAAAIPVAAVTALQGLRDNGRIQAGQNVLINGASGGVGTFAVQIAKALGARVTAVCSTAKMEMVQALGADRVIDYTKEDFTEGAEHYDLVFAANGNLPILKVRNVLTPEGIFVLSGGAMSQLYRFLLIAPVVSMLGKQKMVNYIAKPNREDIDFLAGLHDAGKINPVIDRRYPLQQVPDAVRYLEQGHASGKVVIDNTASE